MKNFNCEFEDNLFKDIFKKNEYYNKLLRHVSHLLKKNIQHIEVLDSSYIEKNETKYELHLFMDVDFRAIWLIFAFGDEREYLKEEYYYQTNDGIKLNDSPPVIRYNIEQICAKYNKRNKEMVKEYGFIIDLLKEFLNTTTQELERKS